MCNPFRDAPYLKEMVTTRVSCSCPATSASLNLLPRLRSIGVQPIVTDFVIRAVYEGPRIELGRAIVDIFDDEKDSEITLYYDKAEQGKAQRRERRKRDKARKNAKLHGH